MGKKSIFSDIISSALGKKGVNYATVVGDVMIGSYEIENLKNIMDDITSATTLTSISEYREQKATMPTITHMMTMVRADLLNKDMAITIKEKRKIYPIALSEVEKYFYSYGKDLTPLRYNFFQTSSTGSTPFMNFKGVWSTSEAREATKAWAFSMQGAPSTQTIAFPNHRYGGFDVLCADATGMLYLISEKGSIYWKKKLPTAVSSPFVVADLYNNKKYQMAFYAGNTFYVIDRNGNAVTDKEKIVAAKKLSTTTPKAKISSTNEVQVQKNGSAITVKTPQSPVSTAVYSPSFDVLLYSVKNGKIYACDTKGTAVGGFPLPAAQYYTAENFAKNGKMGVVTTSTSGSVTMYRLPKTK
ncbi:MAG: hypothetical protein PHD21_05795 [Flavobacteriales bacterium]|nr:hypothetical protein [Flavobacteriales bacterium]